MSNKPQVTDLLLDNGLRVHLIADANASEAAALLQVATGSDQEPETWPGLAHLLEHVLFADSAGFSGPERLISWVPAQGGRLNATTRADRTAFFFAVPPVKLAAGLDRLLNMLACPRLAIEAIAQETAAIDAEYRLLAGDNAHLLETALRRTFRGAPGLSHFQVGCAGTFGADLSVLHQALRALHQRDYHAGAMTLWLQAPSPLADLSALAQQSASILAPARPQPAPAIYRLEPCGDAGLQQDGPPRLCLNLALNDWQQRDPHWLNLFNQQLGDEAPGGLMARLRDADQVDEVRLVEVWRSRHAAIFSIQFTLSRDDTGLRDAVLEQFNHWLTQLSKLTDDQITYSAALANRAFWRQPPLDQLRARAFGLAAAPPPTAQSWQEGILRLRQAAQTRLWVSTMLEGTPARHQGFSLKIADWPPGQLRPSERNFTFWPQDTTQPLPPLPSAARPLFYQPGVNHPCLLLLSQVGETAAATLQAALRPLAAQLAHQHGEWLNDRWQGYWLMQLRAEPAVLEHAAVALCQRLNRLPASACQQGQRAVRRALDQQQHAIAVRRLMAALTRELTPADTPHAAQGLRHLCWQAALMADSETLHQRLAQRLSPLPVAVEPVIRAPEARRFSGLSLPRQGKDAALVLYCPLPQWQRDIRLLWRLLALFCQPRFFQRLRVEKHIGYVASCRFYQWGNEEGIVFALQSPQASADVLLRELQAFLASLPEAVDALDEAAITACGQALTTLLNQQAQDPVWQACAPFFSPQTALSAHSDAAWLARLGRAELQRGVTLLRQAAGQGWLGQVI